jgi:hypothetical protein
MLVFLFSFTPCFAGDVQVVVGKDADFSLYKTYEWLPTKVLTKTGIVEDDPTTTPIVKDAVNRELAAKGLKQVEAGGDLQVATAILTASIPQVEALILPGAPQYGAYGGFEMSPSVTVGRYNREGTFVINLIDARTKKSAWAAMVKKAIDNKPGSGLKKIPKAASELFKKYPVK